MSDEPVGDRVDDVAVARPEGRWRRVPLGARIGIVVVCTLLGINLLGQFVQSSTGGGETPSGKRSSAYATKNDGLAAYAELLGHEGYAVERTRGPLSDARLDPSRTAVILDPETISRDDADVLLTFLVNGGRLVIGGTFPSYFSSLTDHPPEWDPSATTDWTHVASSLKPIARIVTNGDGRFIDVGLTHPLVGDEGDALVTETTVGRGTVVFVADASPIQNRLLATADNAALGLALAGDPGRTVVFPEGVHGYGPSRGHRRDPEPLEDRAGRARPRGADPHVGPGPAARTAGEHEPRAAATARRVRRRDRLVAGAHAATRLGARDRGPQCARANRRARGARSRRGVRRDERARSRGVHPSRARRWIVGRRDRGGTGSDHGRVRARGRARAESPVGRAVGREGSNVRELRDRVVAEVAKVVVGQDHVVDVLLAATSVGGHVLLEGVPGVAKTLLANAFARALGVDFRRVQFTPDMLPSDLTGTMTLRTTASGPDLAFRPGPVFANLVLADEINRTPPKTQSALLEAMQERQVTVDGVPHPLPTPFLVVATQNPIEYEGTYPLPEAQLDRFLAKVDVGYPSAADETAMLRLTHRGVTPSTLADVRPVVSAAELNDLGARVDAVTVSGRRGRVRRRGRAPHARGAECCARCQPAGRDPSPRGGEGRGVHGRSLLRHSRRCAGGRTRGVAPPVADSPRGGARALQRRRRDREHAGRGDRAAVSPTTRAAYAVGVVALLALALPVTLSFALERRVVVATVSDAVLARRPPRLSRSVPSVLVRGVAAPLVVTAGGTAPGRVRVRQPAVPDLTIEPPEADGRLEAHVTARGAVDTSFLRSRPVGSGRSGSEAGSSRAEPTRRSSCIPTFRPRAASSPRCAAVGSATRDCSRADRSASAPSSRPCATTNPTTTSGR